MLGDDIKAPVPLRNRTPSHLNLRELTIKRLNEEHRSRTPGIKSPEARHQSPLRARSTTPNGWRSPIEYKTDQIINARLRHYNLDFPDNIEEYNRVLYDSNSKWFSRDEKPEFKSSEHLCYSIESHQEQAKYLCHVLVNLYIAISSLDIEGSISISNKDLGELKSEIDDLALKTDLFKLSSDSRDHGTNTLGYESFDEEELYNENDYISTTGPDVYATGKITTKSSSIINVNHWTNELKNCMHFDIPLTLRKSLAKVYYYLSLVKGQRSARELHIELFEILVDDDDEGTDFTALLRKENLILDHKILFEFFCSFFPYPDADYTRYDLSSKEDSKLFRQLLKIAFYAKPFFDENDSSIVKGSMDTLLSSFSPSTLSAILPIISSYVPYHYHKESKITDYFPFCFSLWTSVNANVVVDTNMFEFVGYVVEDLYIRSLRESITQFLKQNHIEFGPFGIFSEDQMTFLFNRLQGHLRSSAQIHSYSKTVRPFIYSMMGNEHQFFFEKLKSLLRSIDTYVYPSNSGPWTKPIAKFVHTFIKMYHARVQREKKEIKQGFSSVRCLTIECNSKIISLFLNILRTGAQNKNLSVANYYISCFAYLLDLESNNRHQIFDKILEDVYDALSGEFVDSRHRIISSLKQLTRVVRFMTIDELYRVHITNILTMLIDKLDPNDMGLTGNIMNAIVSIFSFTPFKSLVNEGEYLTFESDTIPFVQEYYFHLKENPSTVFIYDKTLLTRAFKASTTEFKNIIRKYIDKLFQLVDVELDGGFTIKINQTSLILIESMDDELFTYFSEIFQKVFLDNDVFKDKNPNYEIVTTPLAALAKRESRLRIPLLDMLMVIIKQQIERGAGSVRNVSEIQERDVKLVLYLTALNETVRYSYDIIIEYNAKLVDFIKYLFETIANPALDVISSILIHNILASLTTTEVTNYEMFSNNCSIPDEERWGGLQFDKRKFESENLEFKWHNPSTAEIEMAVSIFESTTDYAIEGIEKIISSKTPNTKDVDSIQKYILLLSHALSGASLLFDADFNKNIHGSKTADPSSYRERLLLLKYIREKKYDSQELNIDIEQIGSGKDEDELVTDYNRENDADNKSDIVVINDEISDELYCNEGDISELPSAIGTPIPDQIGTSSSMNCGLSFRDLDIYKCNYFFGTTVEEKFENPLYFEIHKLRSKVGLFYHRLFNYFTENYENNIILFQVLLHGLKVWFTDIGQETLFNEDATAVLDIDFLENVQSLSHLRQPFTRTCLAAIANSYHQERVLLHSTNRYPSRLEIQLLKDIITLGTSIYPDIHSVAQSTLAHIMKQLIGSYAIISNRLISLLNDALKSQSTKKIDVILNVMRLKKIHNKIVRDYKNLGQWILLLLDCCRISEQDISVHADNILTDILMGIRFPSSFCIYDDRMYSPITPPESTIKLQVEAVKKAKESKRLYYLSLISDLTFKIIEKLNENNSSWKTQLFLIRFITKVQSNLETKIEKDAIKAIFSQSYSNHPKLIHLVIKSLLSISNKIMSLSDYNHDISNMVDTSFDPSCVFELETYDNNFRKEFENEMNNITNPKYFIDSKAFVGWLCWGKTVKVISPDMFAINLRDDEIEAFKTFGSLVTKEYLKMIIATLIKDNETRVIFSSSEVSYFVLIIIMISKKYTTLTFEDLFEFCHTYYKRTEKASMIISVEIVGAIVYSSKYITKDEIKKQEFFLTEFLPECLNHDLNQDSFDIWSTLCWWLPSVVDIRRCPPFIKNFTEIGLSLDSTSDRANEQASRLTMLRNILTSLEFRTFEVQPILDSLIFDHPYDKVREVTARLFTTLIQNESYPSIDNPRILLSMERSNDGLGLPLKQISDRMDKIIKSNFNIIFSEFEKVKDLTPQEILKTRFFYVSSSMFYWIREMSKGPNRVLLVPYISDYVLPFLSALVNQKDVCKLAGLDPTRIFLNLASMAIRKTHINGLITLITDTKVIINSSYQIRIQLVFIEYLLSNLLLQLSDDEMTNIYDFLIYQLHNPNFIEVRVRAAAVLSDIVHNMGETEKVHEVIKKFDKEIGEYSWIEKQKLSKTDINIHASILGLGGIINAFPYVFPLPKWIPKQLDILSTWARTSGMGGTAAKEVISEFKKVRADTWKFDRSAFTPEELEDLEGVLWRSYYA